MKYELIENSNVGVIVDATPILRDIKDTFEVSFLLPGEGTFVALFCGADGVERKAIIRNGKVVIPKELLAQEQRVALTVCLTDGETIIHAWECQPIKVGTFLQQRMTQRQISAGLTIDEVLTRLADLERIHAETKSEYLRRTDEYNKATQEYADTLNGLKKALASVEKANETLVQNYNKAIGVVNDLSGRMTAIEKNYDPTVIK